MLGESMLVVLLYGCTSILTGRSGSVQRTDMVPLLRDSGQC